MNDKHSSSDAERITGLPGIISFIARKTMNAPNPNDALYEPDIDKLFAPLNGSDYLRSQAWSVPKEKLEKYVTDFMRERARVSGLSMDEQIKFHRILNAKNEATLLTSVVQDASAGISGQAADEAYNAIQVALGQAALNDRFIPKTVDAGLEKYEPIITARNQALTEAQQIEITQKHNIIGYDAELEVIHATLGKEISGIYLGVKDQANGAKSPKNTPVRPAMTTPDDHMDLQSFVQLRESLFSVGSAITNSPADFSVPVAQVYGALLHLTDKLPETDLVSTRGLEITKRGKTIVAAKTLLETKVNGHDLIMDKRMRSTLESLRQSMENGEKYNTPMHHDNPVLEGSLSSIVPLAAVVLRTEGSAAFSRAEAERKRGPLDHAARVPGTNTHTP